ncbi:DMT family transporter [Carboxydochorda subterranea]|uniref:DMT family transporter n=1 Tax=Carboxydichorda subterranea TaxID=3109565 RepID=A0ABZ1BV05_9FIRM|nr:DMT family transporter [Limnochorda sp. L945t]WRP16491.1 DMT family transporter [Limnochorda sp. L945t]
MLSSAVAFGAMPSLARIAYDHGTGAYALLAIRFSMAFAVLTGVAALAGRWPRQALRPAPLLLGAVGYAGTAIGLFRALQFVPASVASVLFYTYPALVGVVDALVRRRSPGAAQVLSLAGAVAGSALVAGVQPAPLDGRGVLLALGAACCYAGYILAGERTTAGTDAWQLAVGVTAGAAMTTAAMAWADGPGLSGIEGPGWAAGAALALLSTAYAIPAFLAGLARVGPSTAAVLSAGEPLTALLLAVLFLGERLTAPQVAGAVLVVAAMVVASTRPPGPSRAQPPGSAVKGGRPSWSRRTASWRPSTAPRTVSTPGVPQAPRPCGSPRT